MYIIKIIVKFLNQVYELRLPCISPQKKSRPHDLGLLLHGLEIRPC